MTNTFEKELSHEIVHCFVMPKTPCGFCEFTTKKERAFVDFINSHSGGLHKLHKNKDYLLVSLPEYLVAEVILRYKEYTLQRDLNIA